MRRKLQECAAASSKRIGSQATILAVITAGVATGACSGVMPREITSAAGPQSCLALRGKYIAPPLIGEPSSGAMIVSATLLKASVDLLGRDEDEIVKAAPDYCRVIVDISPVDPSAPTVTAQVNLPTEWNGKKLQFGGGGYNGVLITGVQPSRNAPPDAAMPLTRGYMTAGTDSGHQTSHGGDPFSFALNKEALENFAFAAYKKTNDVAVQIALLYYGKKPSRNYYMGASEGGREAMTMAQRYPADYDGIIAIDPVMNWSGLQTFGNFVGGILQSKPDAWLGGKTQLLHDTVVQACDKLDGIADGVVSNYFSCKTRADAALDAKRCPTVSVDGPNCFTDNQLAVIKAVHQGYSFDFSRANGMKAYAGFNYGSEGLPGNWERWIAGLTPPAAGPDANQISQLFAYGSGYVRYFIAQDRTVDPLAYDPNKFKDRVTAVSQMMDATDPDLTPFFRRGGKLILREDLSDMAQSPFTGLQYWDTVTEKMGKTTVDDFFAAYVATGLPHTSGGVPAGTSNAPVYGTAGRIDLLPLLEAWVEHGTKPSNRYDLTNQEPFPPYRIIASKPLCRYGTYPKFVGSNPTGGNLASNYTCVDDRP